MLNNYDITIQSPLHSIKSPFSPVNHHQITEKTRKSPCFTINHYRNHYRNHHRNHSRNHHGSYQPPGYMTSSPCENHPWPWWPTWQPGRHLVRGLRVTSCGLGAPPEFRWYPGVTGEISIYGYGYL